MVYWDSVLPMVPDVVSLSLILPSAYSNVQLFFITHSSHNVFWTYEETRKVILEFLSVYEVTVIIDSAAV